VVGPSGSGKSVLGKRVAESLGLVHVELDALFWERDWKEAAPETFRARADQATRAPAWIVDGNYRLVRDIAWPRAEAVLWLDYSLPLVLRRLTWRILRRGLTREVLWHGNREKLWWHLKLWSEHSLFNWLLKTYWQYKRAYPLLFAEPAHAHLAVIHQRSPRETDAWLARLA
jgi:adenylate kinase family enzyme